MTSFHTNGVLFKNIFSTPEMREIFSEERFIECFLEVEGALAQAEAHEDLIPESAADEITAKASLEYLDLTKVEANVADIHLFSMSIIGAWKEAIGDAGEYIHWGATTQDISDTALVLQIREGLDIIERDLAAVGDALEHLTEQYAETPMIGRTHMVHALPITFGLKVATWLDEVNRHRDRIDSLRERIEVLEFFGAVGSLASLGKDGLAVQKTLADELDLAVPNAAWFTARDRIAEVVATVGLITSTLTRISKQVLLMNREEFGELSEPFEEGEIGSSTMPHKRNPVRNEETIMLGRLTRAHVSTALELMETFDERDFSATLAEFAVVPETFLYASRALQYVHEVTSGLVVYESDMIENLHHHNDLITSEAVMMALAETLGRQTAHNVTHEAAMRAFEGRVSFADALLEDNRVTSVFSQEDINDLTDPESYTGISAELARRTLNYSQTHY